MRVVRALWLALLTAFIALFCTAATGTPASPVTPARAAAPATAVAAPAPWVAPQVAPQVAAPAAPAVPAAQVVVAQEAPAREVELPRTPPAPVAVPGTPCVSSARACVDLSSNQAWLIADGAISYGPVPITSGRKGFRTSPGTFTVTFKNRDHVSSIYDAPMPYSVFFNGGIAFHQGSLREKSHGCIHLSGAAAREFFATLGRGDVVQVVR